MSPRLGWWPANPIVRYPFLSKLDELSKIARCAAKVAARTCPSGSDWEAASRLHEGLHPTLDADRLALFEQQKKFLFTHGFLDADFALDDWIDPRPLEAARAINARAIPPELV
jgi:hypothetical protein